MMRTKKKKSHSPIVNCRLDGGLLDGEERGSTGWDPTPCSVAGLPVRSGIEDDEAGYLVRRRSLVLADGTASWTSRTGAYC